jgi:hypothetical protein
MSMGKQKKVTITLFEDNTCSMAKVMINKYCVFEGNEWDFHPGCFGPINLNSQYMAKNIQIDYFLDDFKGSDDFFEQVVKAYEQEGYLVQSFHDEYLFEK